MRSPAVQRLRDNARLHPGEAAWRWHLQLKVERVGSPLRALLILLTTVAWVVLPPAAGSLPGLARSVAVLAWVYAITDLLVIFRRPALAERSPYVTVMLDWLFVVVWTVATGGAASPYLPLIFVGVFTAPTRLPWPQALAGVAAYTAAYLGLAGAGHWLPAGYVALGGLLQCGWLAVMRDDRRNSLRDALTGCLGRDYGLFQLQHMLQHGPWPFSVGLIDLDGFKAVNDSHGHAAGDVLLGQCTRLIDALVRPDDLLVRYGGDEFLLIWPQMPMEAACGAAERIRDHVEQAVFLLRSEATSVRLTVSIGVAAARRGESAAAILRRVDECLYQAKVQRNRVVSPAEPAC